MTLVPPRAEPLRAVRGSGRALNSNELAYGLWPGMLGSSCDPQRQFQRDDWHQHRQRAASFHCSCCLQMFSKYGETNLCLVMVWCKKFQPVLQVPKAEEVTWCWRRPRKTESPGNVGTSKTVTPRSDGCSRYLEYSHGVFYPSIYSYHQEESF